MVRKIVYSFDKEFLKIVNLNDIISSKSEGFDERYKYNSDRNRFLCVECDQVLVVAHSKNDNVYFRHNPNSEYCILKDINNDLEYIYKLKAYQRESPRHKELKNRIGQLLKKDPKIDSGTIDIDSTFIYGKDGKKRRPDVYCVYEGKKIAFEIQLSYLPLHYIIHRFKFYQENGIYLLWILDSINSPKSISTFQRDLKYNSEHQNLFILDDSQSNELKFNCHFKQVYIYDNKEIHEKWQNELINLSDLNFDEGNYSCYYYNTGKELKHLDLKLLSIQNDIENKRQVINQLARKKFIDDLVNKIKIYKKNDSNFYYLMQEIELLEFDIVEELNRQIELDRVLESGIPIFLSYIKSYKKKQQYLDKNFIYFLLGSINLKFDINRKDHNGLGVIQYFYNNQDLSGLDYLLKPLIFKRGYKLQLEDKEFLNTKFGLDGQLKYLQFSYYQDCETDEERSFVRTHLTFFYFIESANSMIITGTRVKSWVQYTVQILNRYGDLWKYIRIVLNQTQLGKELQIKDKKGTIKAKIHEFKLNEDYDNSMVSNLLWRIYPTLFF